MTSSTIEGLIGRELKLATAQALGVKVVSYGDERTGYEDYVAHPTRLCDDEPEIIGRLPDYPCDPSAWHAVLLQGVEDFGGFGCSADMETWEIGGLFIAWFMDCPQTYWAPMGEAVCKAYLIAKHCGPRDFSAETNESTEG